MTLHRFVLHDRVPDYLRLGWLALSSLEGTHHGFWSAHCIWLCSCKAAEPLPLSQRNIEGA
ncbi:hypothetical protein ABIE93_005989 [Bradyrhizobium elkanii]